MAETRYSYGPGTYKLPQLQSEIIAAGLPTPTGMYGTYTTIGNFASAVQIGFDPALTGPQKTTLDTTVAAHVAAADRKPRTLLAIRNDLAALTVLQKTEIWTDITSGTPAKWATDSGPNAAALAVLQLLGASITLSAADVLEAKLRGVAMYCQDNPNYLVSPTFDATINVPGDQPA